MSEERCRKQRMKKRKERKSMACYTSVGAIARDAWRPRGVYAWWYRVHDPGSIAIRRPRGGSIFINCGLRLRPSSTLMTHHRPSSESPSDEGGEDRMCTTDDLCFVAAIVKVAGSMPFSRVETCLGEDAAAVHECRWSNKQAAASLADEGVATTDSVTADGRDVLPRLLSSPDSLIESVGRGCLGLEMGSGGCGKAVTGVETQSVGGMGCLRGSNSLGGRNEGSSGEEDIGWMGSFGDGAPAAAPCGMSDAHARIPSGPFPSHRDFEENSASCSTTCSCASTTERGRYVGNAVGSSRLRHSGEQYGAAPFCRRE
jgi:hypothetical protein